jgi:DNA-3-methyladenine glycosylase
LERHGSGTQKSVILPRAFYTRDTVTVARELLGKVLKHGETAGIIVESEAYLGGDDLASHSAAGITPRTRVIFGPPGHVYVYLSYGMHECLNIVAEPEGKAGCVLIRAVEPCEGLEIIRARRPGARTDRDLASGPGRLTKALAITRAQNGADVTRGDLTVNRPRHEHHFEIDVTPRIGITKCADWPLRFVIRGNKFVSR